MGLTDGVSSGVERAPNDPMKLTVACGARSLSANVGRTRSSGPVLPVARSTLQMGDGHDDDLTRPQAVHELIRKS